MVEFLPVNEKDLVAICNLLESAALPTGGVNHHLATFFKIADRDRLIGAAGLEVYHNKALLRSVVVASQDQNQGHGHNLIKGILRSAQEMKISDLYLLTETAPDFFAQFGFEVITRPEVNNKVRATAEFQFLCPESAICMHLKLD